MPSPHYGASPEDWEVLASRYGLTADLLPVVTNPGAEVSPNSALKSFGKVPSRYNNARQVSGFNGWTSHRATPEQVAAWSAEPDYGICVIARTVRAIDIDIDDREQAAAVVAAVVEIVGLALPMRYRANSGKCALLFKMHGAFDKVSFKTKGGAIEFLANKQHFVIAGAHSSGARYEIAGGWPVEIPELSAEAFEALWAELHRRFGVGEARGLTSYRDRRPKGDTVTVHDPVLDRLDVLGWGAEGQAFITCPFEDGHSTPSTISTTCYFPKGTRGYAQGHFKCLHASCTEQYKDGDYIRALGVVAQDFEEIAESDIVSASVEGGFPVLPEGLTRSKNGEIRPSACNIKAVLMSPTACGLIIRFDEFKGCVMRALEGAPLETRVWRDTDYYEVRMRLERIGFPHTLGANTLREAVAYVAEELRPFDSGKEWLDRLVWDGLPRAANFARDYLRMEDTPYARAASCYMWTALAGRVMVPGIKADMVPVFVSKEQGYGKTSCINAMVPSADHITSIHFAQGMDNLARGMCGKLVYEIDELRGLGTRDAESIKSFITKTHDRWIPKYLEKERVYGRRGIFIGTTNDEQFLSDPTGNRRWLPMRVGVIDVDAVVRDRDQLWAEAKSLFEFFGGVLWQDAERLAPSVQDDYVEIDVWEELIAGWLNNPVCEDVAQSSVDVAQREGFTTSDILKHALNYEFANSNSKQGKRVSAILNKLGYRQQRPRAEGHQSRVWYRVV